MNEDREKDKIIEEKDKEIKRLNKELSNCKRQLNEKQKTIENLFSIRKKDKSNVFLDKAVININKQLTEENINLRKTPKEIDKKLKDNIEFLKKENEELKWRLITKGDKKQTEGYLKIENARLKDDNYRLRISIFARNSYEDFLEAELKNMHEPLFSAFRQGFKEFGKEVFIDDRKYESKESNNSKEEEINSKLEQYFKTELTKGNKETDLTLLSELKFNNFIEAMIPDDTEAANVSLRMLYHMNRGAYRQDSNGDKTEEGFFRQMIERAPDGMANFEKRLISKVKEKYPDIENTLATHVHEILSKDEVIPRPVIPRPVIPRPVILPKCSPKEPCKQRILSPIMVADSSTSPTKKTPTKEDPNKDKAKEDDKKKE